MTTSEQWQTVWKVVAYTAPFGVPVGLILGYFLGDGSLRSFTSGGLIGFLISFGMVFFEVSWVVGLIPRRWREARFIIVLITRSLTMLAIILVGISLPLVFLEQVPASELAGPSVAISALIGFAFALVINFIGQVNRLLGRGVLVSLIIGRYHRPIEEVRIFLLVDLRQSSKIAEQLGNLRYHAFLKRFIDDVSISAARFGGEVHRYVGDEVILTWKRSNGLENAACVRCMFAIEESFIAGRDEYLSDFGVVPSTWAGLHMGPVVTGDIGSIKHEIVHLGDTLNVAARIEQACRDFQRTFLASGDVVEALNLPDGMRTEDLGPIELRGIGSSVELVALSSSDAGVS